MALLVSLELREFDASTLTDSYQDLGDPISNPAFRIVFSNESDVGVYISTDGSTNEIRLSPYQILILDSYPRHNTYNEGSYVLKKGAQLSVKKSGSGGTGVIIVNIETTRGYV